MLFRSDSTSGPEGWEHRDGLEPLRTARVESVGFQLPDCDSRYITLASDVSETQIRGRISIPTSAIEGPIVQLTMLKEKL